MTDFFNLQRFVDAQAPVYPDVLNELRTGYKTTHWMWYIFPQLKELGRSAIAKHYGTSSRVESVAYLDHPLLGQRLLECTEFMLAAKDKTALEILGSPDDLKFRSCLTLFRAADPALPIWDAALGKYYDGKVDAATLALI